jgi:hypothetical protein
MAEDKDEIKRQRQSIKAFKALALKTVFIKYQSIEYH